MSDGRDRAFWGLVALLAILYFLLTIGLGFSAWVPDLLTVAALLGARRLSGAGAAALGLGAGLLRDAVAVQAFGADALVLALLGYLGARSRDLFEGDSLVFFAVYLFLGKWLHDLGYLGVARGDARGGVVNWMLMDRPVVALYTAAAGVVALLLFRASTGER